MRNRWGVSPNTICAAGKLADIPSQFGDWKLVSKGKLGETEKTMLECAGFFVGEYRNRVSGEAVNVTVLLGPPGTIAAHTPEVCFPSTGYTALGEREGDPLSAARTNKTIRFGGSHTTSTTSTEGYSARVMPGAPGNVGPPASSLAL